jgi:hypothetical protein
MKMRRGIENAVEMGQLSALAHHDITMLLRFFSDCRPTGFVAHTRLDIQFRKNVSSSGTA